MADTSHLLIGAGFTHNFGAPLAAGMWSLIFSNPALQACPPLRQIFLDDTDYESAYHKIMQGDYASEVRSVLERAVIAAYQHLDANIRNYHFGSGAAHPINIYKVQDLIATFGRNLTRPGYVFTLNQDLFVERRYYNGPTLVLPGIVARDDWFTSHFDSPLSSRDVVTLPNTDQVAVHRSQHGQSGFYYVKLHGSMNWRSGISGRGIVIGRGKSTQIEREPLLSWYHELFRDALCQEHTRLLVIGYSFSDDHINEVIGVAVRDYGLRLYVLDPTLPNEWQFKMTQQNRGNDLIRGLSGYYPYVFEGMFPGDQSITAEYRNVLRGVFGMEFDGDEIAI